jgi:hypothetical protein
MTGSLKHHACALGLAFCMLTVLPAASHSPFVSAAGQAGGESVVHKNGPTPMWMAEVSAPAKARS